MQSLMSDVYIDASNFHQEGKGKHVPAAIYFAFASNKKGM
jgi:hypothetical protein